MMPLAKDLDNLLLIVLHSSEALVTLGRLSVYLGNFNVLCFRILVLSSGGCWSGSLAQVCKSWFSCITSLMPRAHIHVQNSPHSPDPHGELWGKVGGAGWRQGCGLLGTLLQRSEFSTGRSLCAFRHVGLLGAQASSLHPIFLSQYLWISKSTENRRIQSKRVRLSFSFEK